MKKLRLAIEQLEVESFGTVEDGEDGRGTVRGLGTSITASAIARKTSFLQDALGTQLFGSGAGQGPVHQLSRAMPERSFAARLSIHTRYQACTPLPPRDSATVPGNECGEREDAAVDPNEFAAGGQSSAPDSLQASALAALIWWDEADERAMDAPIERLEKALRLTLAPVPLLVDLSAAHLLRAERTQNPRDLSEALEAARRALEHEPRNLPALFNAALAILAGVVDLLAGAGWSVGNVDCTVVLEAPRLAPYRAQMVANLAGGGWPDRVSAAAVAGVADLGGVSVSLGVRHRREGRRRQ